MGSGWSNYFNDQPSGRTSNRPGYGSRNSRDPPYNYPPRYRFNNYDDNPDDPEPAPAPEPAPVPTPEPEPTPAPEQPEIVSKPPLKVKAVDYNIKQNAREHHTNDYDLVEGFVDEDNTQKGPELVIRRGQVFEVTLTLDRAYDEQQDYLHIMFEIGTNPKESKKTLVHLDMDGISQNSDWSSEVKESQGGKVTVNIKAGAECIIGKWQFVVHTSIKTVPKEINRYINKHPIYILFNAWCKEDPVYMDNEVDLDEYVLNDVGKMFRGSAYQIGGRPWNFGQFDENVLECAMYLLDKTGLNFQTRGDPIHVSRAISAIVNAPNDGGVLIGNWSGDYDGGTRPTYWVGSVKILEQYFKTKQPVKFGQCWVFSGITTTVSRALGLPCRSVTNFASAHDTDGTITIDKHFDNDGKPIKNMDEDSVWNFHVWNEAWMVRRDLPTGHEGWQAFDATPQETSGGVYQAGPASVKAIKEGNVNNQYDAAFIFAEVNADRIHWGQRENGRFDKVLRIVKNSIGKNLSTSRPRKNPRPESWYNDPYRRSEDEHRLDLTDTYKYPEYSENERAAVYRANLNARSNIAEKIDRTVRRTGGEDLATALSRANKVYDEDIGVQDVKFALKQKDGVMVGSVFNVVLEMQNTSREERNVHVELEIFSVFYTGVVSDNKPLKAQTYNITLPAVKSKEAVMRVTMDDYIHKIVEQVTFEIDVFARVAETGQEYPDTDLYRLRRPDLTVIAPETAKVGQAIPITIKLESPMPVHLTECEWDVEGAHLLRPKTISRADVEPYEHIELTLEITPKKAGMRQLLASFTSKELQDITGFCPIIVVD